MRLITSIALAISVLSVLPAFADRQVTEEERAKLSTAVQTEGCSGGKFEMDEDDQQFEVDDAVCADGKKYDLKFDMQMPAEAQKSGLRLAPVGHRRIHVLQEGHGRPSP